MCEDVITSMIIRGSRRIRQCISEKGLGSNYRIKKVGHHGGDRCYWSPIAVTVIVWRETTTIGGLVNFDLKSVCYGTRAIFSATGVCRQTSEHSWNSTGLELSTSFLFRPIQIVLN